MMLMSCMVCLLNWLKCNIDILVCNGYDNCLRKKNMKSVDEFVDQCIDNGITSGKDISNAAKNKIVEIDNEIARIASLRESRSILQDVIRTFDTKTKTVRKARPAINEMVSDASVLEGNSLLVDICNYIEKSSSPRNARSITEAVGFATSDPSPVYFGLKTLRDVGIIKNTEEKLWDKGVNWDKRPV